MHDAAPSATVAPPRPRTAQDRTTVPDMPALITRVPPRDFDRSGQTLGGTYRLVEYVGHGAFSEVYRGEHLRLHLPIAVKVANEVGRHDPAGCEQQFRSEALLLAQLDHPNIVRLWDFALEPVPYLVTEYVPGGTLGDAIRDRGQLGWRAAVRVGAAVAAALGALADRGMVHRDIKPDNVLLMPTGRAKLADLGLAVLRTGRGVYGPTAARKAGISGTVAYIAPEQALESGDVDFRADMYSLGATLYHAVAGRPPFGGAGKAELLLKHVRQMPPLLHELVPGMDLAASALIMRLLAKEPDARFPSYDALRAAATRLLAA